MAKFSSALNRWLRLGDQVALKTSGAETESTTGSAKDLGHAGVALYTVDVTAASGTPTMTVDIEGSFDGGTTWVVLGTIGANGYRAGSVGTAPSNITGTGTIRAVLPAAPKVRYKSTIGGGTPSLTYSVTADPVG